MINIDILNSKNGISVRFLGMSTSSHASTAQAACEVQTIVELHTLDSATPEHSSLTDSLGGNEAWRTVGQIPKNVKKPQT